MQRLGRIALVVAVVAMVCSSALAQERQQRQRRQRQQGQQQGQRGGFGGGFGGGTLFLLNQKSVQDELKLSDEQTKKIKELDDKVRQIIQGTTDRREAFRKAREQREANEKAVAEILKPEQRKRIKQISLQQQGGRALSDPEVAKALNLSDQQKDKIRSIQQEARTARGQRGQGRPSEEELKKREEARKATNEKLMNVLTDEQKTKWKEMTGEPFKGEIRRPQLRRPQASQQ